MPPALDTEAEQALAEAEMAEKSAEPPTKSLQRIAADSTLSRCFVTQDLVSLSERGDGSAGAPTFEGRVGFIVKVLGKQVNLLRIEAAVKV